MVYKVSRSWMFRIHLFGKDISFVKRYDNTNIYIDVCDEYNSDKECYIRRLDLVDNHKLCLKYNKWKDSGDRCEL